MKMFKFLFITIFLFIQTACATNIDTTKWTTIVIDKDNSFKVPPEWIMTRVDGKMVFSDQELSNQNVHIYMVEISFFGSNENDVRFTSTIGNGRIIRDIHTEVNSDSTVYSVSEVEFINEIDDYRFLEIDRRDGVTFFFVYDNDVKTKIIKTILESRFINYN